MTRPLERSQLPGEASSYLILSHVKGSCALGRFPGLFPPSQQAL